MNPPPPITLTTEGTTFHRSTGEAAENRKRNGISALDKGSSLKAITIPRERKQSPKEDETLASQPEAKRANKRPQEGVEKAGSGHMSQLRCRCSESHPVTSGSYRHCTARGREDERLGRFQAL